MGFPIKNNIEWKGKTFVQIIASIQQNQNNASHLDINQLMKPQPLSIYRKEIHNINGQTKNKICNSRISMTISDYETPGSTIVSRTQNNPYYSNGIITSVEYTNPTTLTAEHGKCDVSNNCFLSPQNNARKRCRSAGMIQRKFNANKNNDTYSSSTQQYLTSRNRTIKQNEYHFIRKGSSGIIPGPGLGASNVYSPGGLSHCWQPTISAANDNNSFNYIWIDGTSYSVIIPDGVYDIGTLNQFFQTVQIKNKTYFNGPGGTKNFLLNISYDILTGSTVVFAGVTSVNSCNLLGYTAPIGANWNLSNIVNTPGTLWSYQADRDRVNGLPQTDPIPSNNVYNYMKGATYFIVFKDTSFSTVIGFVNGTYSTGINESAFRGQITPAYVPLYYKPNNPQYGVQGAVDASARLQRLKYESITSSAGGVRSSYGSAAANALAYGVSETAYTEKTQVGDKQICTPVINKYNGKLIPQKHIYRL
jgi:hypothetical protein